MSLEIERASRRHASLAHGGAVRTGGRLTSVHKFQFTPQAGEGGS